MENPGLTMKEYRELEAKRARRHGRAFNWETATYGKVRYFDDYNYLKDFENEFSAIVYDDALTSRLEISSEHADIVDVNVPKKSHEFNEDFETNVTYITNRLPPRAQRHLWLTYEVEGYTKGIVQDYEHRLAMIFSRQVNHVHILDFEGLTDEMRQGLTDRLRMLYTGGEGHVLFTSHAWRRLFKIRGSLVREFMLEFFSTCRISDTKMGLDIANTMCFQLDGARRSMIWRQFILSLGLHIAKEMTGDGFDVYWLGSTRAIPDKGDLRAYWIGISLDGDFWGAQAPEKVTATDLIYLRSIDEGRVNVPYLLAHDEGLIGLTMIAYELPVIDMDVLVVTVGSSKGVEGSPIVDEGVQAILALVQAPQAPPPAASRTMPQRMIRLEDEVHGLRESLDEQHEVMDAIARYFSRFTMWATSDISQLLDLSRAAYTRDCVYASAFRYSGSSVSSSCMSRSKKRYAMDLLERAHMLNDNPTLTLIDTEPKISPGGTFISDPTLYRSLVGSSHVAYSNTDCVGCPTTRKSTSRIYVFMGSNLLSWSSKRQPTISRSSAEGQYHGIANVVAEMAWMRNLLRELHTPLLNATLVYCDNVSVVYLSANPVQHQQTKHIEIDIHFVRDMVVVGHVRVLHFHLVTSMSISLPKVFLRRY
uniref:Ribonuclease H-like domain-containing protein n=1 Tax=Tanacetum cinerariifolium TaxID=118510 RepID=A0A699H1A7_TANCI|nr:ribonuclease H-like domain-containing protein [Tanacetum cinerariifolium]